MKVLFFIFLSILIIKPTFAQSLASPAIGRSANLSSLAARQYLSGKSEESLALYQKAIAKAESEYGKNSRVVEDLYYQLGVRAFWLSKFNLAERSFKKAVEINPNSEAAQLSLINLLRFRNRDVEVYEYIQQALKKHPDSASLRKDLVISLQDRNPVKATEQAYLLNCVQNGMTEKIGAFKQETTTPKPETPIEPKKLDKREKSEKDEKDKKAKMDKNERKSNAKKNPAKSANPDSLANRKNPANPDNLANKKDPSQADKQPNKKVKSLANRASESDSATATASRAIYEPIKNTAPTITAPKKATSSHKKSSKDKMHAEKFPAGLVPPPPPDTMGFPSSMSGLRAKAGIIKLERTKPVRQLSQPTSEPKPAAEHSASENDPDFLIEWASVKKKHPQANSQNNPQGK